MGLRSGAWVPILLMVPNLAWMLLPRSTPASARASPRALKVTENAARVAVMVLPFLYSLDFNGRFAVPVTTAMALALVLYYAGWIRYFSAGRLPALLFAPMFGVPLPMAIVPSVFLVLASYLMGSWPMCASALVFGLAHVWSSALSREG